MFAPIIAPQASAPPRRPRRGTTRRRLLAAAGTLILAATAACSTTDAPGRTTIVIADSFSAKHPVGAGVQAFVKALRADGAKVGIDVDYYAAGQLGKQKEMLTLVRTGAVDMGIMIPSYLANDLPLSGVGDLPGLVDDPCVTTQVLDPLVRPGGIVFEKEIKARGIVPVYGASIAGYEVFTSTRAIPTPESIRDLLIRSPGGVGDRVAAGIGVTPITMPVNDLYEAVSRGTVDGALLARYAMISYSLQEVLTHGTQDANLGTVTTWMSMNAAKWNGLNDAQKKVVLDAGEIGRATACKSVAAADTAAVATLKKAGVTFDPVTPETRPGWDAALAGIRTSWTRDLDGVGLPASEVLRAVEARIGEVVR
ncbi:TRAP transporter substrate-binding protein DctP [Tsukamurella sp. NPDC003166]|uniref:TRAP transporter substrate-binding protein DctP n=1 Tax=Tsukamurella sp. NPDC003166 TaxID=3154444 RepID=UPI0033B6A762